MARKSIKEMLLSRHCFEDFCFGFFCPVEEEEESNFIDPPKEILYLLFVVDVLWLAVNRLICRYFDHDYECHSVINGNSGNEYHSCKRCDFEQHICWY